MEELLGIFITNVVISLPAQPSVGQTVVQEFVVSGAKIGINYQPLLDLLIQIEIQKQL